MGLVHAGMAQHGQAVFAHTQTNGRGQRQRTWISESGANINISLIIEPEGLATSQMFLLSKAVAVGTLQFLDRHVKSETSVKWPNDLYWRDRKAGGILIENVVQGTGWKYAIVGIGININQTAFGDLDGKAVSLRQITGRKMDPVAAAKELCTYIDRTYAEIFTLPQHIIETYRDRLYKKGETARLKKGTRVFDAVIKDVTETGQLVVQHAVEEKLEVGAVEWVH